MVTRVAFLKRMALAAAACAFIDVAWPREYVAFIEDVGYFRLYDAIQDAKPGDKIVLAGEPAMYIPVRGPDYELRTQ